MIVHNPKAFLEILAGREFPMDAAPLPQGVFMVEPDAFRVNPESATDNAYLDLQNAADPDEALRQSRKLAHAIRDKGVNVKVFSGDPDATDGVFPNNAFATVPGRLIVGSMWHPGRRSETNRRDIREHFVADGYDVVDLSKQNCVAELTGPLIIDRARRIGFCGMSDRIDHAGLEAMHKAFELRLTFAFQLAPGEYHTNVIMMILAGRACVLCPESFADPAVPEAICRAFPDRCLLLSVEEKNAFAGNCIALTDKNLFMSACGYRALRPSSLETLQNWGFELNTAELNEIEKAGGSLRCMVAEIF